jgi:hypothetical protein
MYGSNVYSHRIGYDASSSCATNPVPNTLMASLPSDLRAVMKPMAIYSHNSAGSSISNANVTQSIDYLPTLSEYEIHGTIGNAFPEEENYQKQYAYYIDGNSKIKYKHNDTTTAA